MRKILLVAKREYAETVRTRAFLIGVLFTPLMMIGIIFLTRMMDKKGETETLPLRHVIVSDAGGELIDALERSFDQHNEALPNQQLSLERLVAADGDEEGALEAAKQRVRRGEAKGVLVADAGTVSEGAPVSLFTNRANDLEFNGLMRSLATDAARARRGELLDLSAETVSRLSARVPVKVFDVNVGEEKQADQLVAMMTPFAFMFLLFMGIFGVSQGLLTSVIEEKSSRVMEVLLSGLSSVQLMAGKIVGIALVGFTLMGLWVGAGYFTARQQGLEHALRLEHPVWFLIYYLLGFLLLASLLAALGSAVNSLKEAQSLMSPITVVMVIPMMAWFFIMQYPNSPWVTAMSFFPPITPFVMVLRLCGSQPVPAWQLPATALVLGLSALGTVWISAKVFRVGVLMYGKPPTPREILRWVTYK